MKHSKRYKKQLYCLEKIQLPSARYITDPAKQKDPRFRASKSQQKISTWFRNNSIISASKCNQCLKDNNVTSSMIDHYIPDSDVLIIWDIDTLPENTPWLNTPYPG